jgi:hypothetical protein
MQVRRRYQRMTKLRSEIRDLLLYVLISCVICGALLVALFTGVPWEIAGKVFYFSGFTAIFLWYLIVGSREFWKRPSLWVVICLFFLVHCLLFVAFLSHASPPQSLLGIVPVLCELFLFNVVKDRLFGKHS